MKEYIGDSIYCNFDGQEITLTTENGYPDDPRNIIVLDLDLYLRFVGFMERAVERFKPK